MSQFSIRSRFAISCRRKSFRSKFFKPHSLCSLFSIIFACLFYSQTLYAACGSPLTVGWEVWEPFQFKDKQQNYKGLDFELFQVAMEKIGCGYEFVEMPWKRIITEMQLGSVDVVIGASKTKEREGFGMYSEPFRFEKMVLFVRKGESAKHPYRSFDEMFASDFVLGATLGYAYGKKYDNAMAKYPEYKRQMNLVSQDSQNYDMLLFGRIDGFLGEQHHVSYDLKKRGKRHLVEIHPIEVISGNVYVMFSKKTISREFVDSFDKALADIRRNGDYDKVVYKYLR